MLATVLNTLIFFFFLNGDECLASVWNIVLGCWIWQNGGSAPLYSAPCPVWPPALHRCSLHFSPPTALTSPQSDAADQGPFWFACSSPHPALTLAAGPGGHRQRKSLTPDTVLLFFFNNKSVKHYMCQEAWMNHIVLSAKPGACATAGSQPEKLSRLFGGPQRRNALIHIDHTDLGEDDCGQPQSNTQLSL